MTRLEGGQQVQGCSLGLELPIWEPETKPLCLELSK